MRLPWRRRGAHGGAAPSPPREAAAGGGWRLAAPAEPPGWDGEPRGEPGIHGVPRSRRWDAVVAADAAALGGDRHVFVVLADGTPVPLDDAPPGELAPLVRAVGHTVERPYRAQAVAQGGGRWAVAVVRTRVEELHGVEGRELELTVAGGRRSVRADGLPVFGAFPSLERIAEDGLAGDGGRDLVVRAWRLLGDAWEVEVLRL